MSWRLVISLLVFWIGSSAAAVGAGELLVNGDFEGPVSACGNNDWCPQGWDLVETRNTENSVAANVADNGPNHPGVTAWEFSRSGGGVSGDVTALRQTMGHHTLFKTHYVLSLDVKVDSHNLEAGGLVAPAFEWPAYVRIRYTDTFGNPQVWFFGWYVDPPGDGRALDPGAGLLPLYRDLQIPPSTWTSHVFDLKTELPMLKRIDEIEVGGSGWDYGSRIDNVSLEESSLFARSDCENVAFEDLPAGGLWTAGGSFATDDISVFVTDFHFNPGPCAGPTTSNTVRIGTNGLACGAGQELEINNVSLEVDFHGPVDQVMIPYGEYGGTVEFSVNGACQVVDNLALLHGVNLGGVQVSVIDFGTPGQGCGVVVLDGVVMGLLIGGQELFLDDLSYCRPCETPLVSFFDDLLPGATFPPGIAFNSHDAAFEVREFYFGPGCTNPFGGGMATTQPVGLSCGNGIELAVNNVNVSVDFGYPLDWLVLSYGEYGGNLNLEVNGQCIEFSNFADISGGLVGGARVWNVDQGQPGNSCGRLYVASNPTPIGSFVLGGQELFIDDVRACPVTTTDVPPDATVEQAPSRTTLHPNVPNPFNPVTTILFDVAHAGPTRVHVYDLQGRLVHVLVDAVLPAGRHRTSWNGEDRYGRAVASGIYVVRLVASDHVASRKVVLMK